MMTTKYGRYPHQPRRQSSLITIEIVYTEFREKCTGAPLQRESQYRRPYPTFGDRQSEMGNAVVAGQLDHLGSIISSLRSSGDRVERNVDMMATDTCQHPSRRRSRRHSR